MTTSGLKFRQEVEKIVEYDTFATPESEKFFLDNDFVEPFTGTENTKKEESERSTQDDYEDSMPKLESSARTSFEDKLKSFTELLLLIHGQSGTGKSSYAHNLTRSIENCEFIFMDFTKFVPSVRFNNVDFDLTKQTDFSHKDNNLWKISALLLMKISNRLRKKKSEEIIDYLIKLNEISETYKLVFDNDEFVSDDDDPRGDSKYPELFNILAAYDIDSFTSQFQKFITTNFLSSNNEATEAINFFIGLLMRLTCCLYVGSNVRYILALDNIE